jgi:low affinity Fe/Cu permease
MFKLCLILRLLGIISFVSGNELFINGTNLAINVLALLLLPILQATQNHAGAALQAKLDELMKAGAEARNTFIGLENHAEHEIEKLRPVPESVVDTPARDS